MIKMQALISQLSAVPWDIIRGIYGPIPKMPNLVIQLTFSDKDQSLEAIRQISDNVFHQDSVSEATTLLIPFLVSILERDDVVIKPQIFGLLINIASSWLYINRLLPLGYEVNQEAYMEHHRTYLAILSGVSVYLQCAASNDVATVVGAVVILAKCMSKAQIAIPILLSYLLQHQAANEDILTIMIWFLSIFTSLQSTQERIAFETGLEKIPIQNVNSVTALGLSFIVAIICIHKYTVSRERFGYLLHLAKQYTQINNLPWGDTALTYICSNLHFLDEPRAIEVFGVLIEVAANKVHLCEVIRRLLNFVLQKHEDYLLLTDINNINSGNEIFYHIPPTIQDVEQVTLVQQQALKYIFDSERFWQVKTNLLAIYGLPKDKAKFQILMASN